MVHNPLERLLFPILPADSIDELCRQGDVVELADGEC